MANTKEPSNESTRIEKVTGAAGRAARRPVLGFSPPGFAKMIRIAQRTDGPTLHWAGGVRVPSDEFGVPKTKTDSN